MPVVTTSGSAPKVVVINHRSNVATVTARASAVQVPSSGPAVGVVVDRTAVVNVASPGAQGPAGASGGPPGPPGPPGASAYAEAVATGFTGTEAEWLASLRGEPGPPGVGTPGEPGQPGTPGKDSTVPGPAGPSAFAVAVTNGFVGDEATWLASLQGEPGQDSTVPGPRGADSTVPGPPGDPGSPGDPGPSGLSAYAVAAAAGFTGTEAQWLASLKGEPGDPGTPGTPGEDGKDGADANPSGGIIVQAGSADGTDLRDGLLIRGLLPAGYTLQGSWHLRCDPTGSIELDVWRTPLSGEPSEAGSLVAGAYPAVVAGTYATGSLSGWISELPRGVQLTVVVRATSDVRWFALMLEAQR